MAERLYIQNRRKREARRRKLRLCLKVLLVLCGCVLLVWALRRTVIHIGKPGSETGEETEGIPLQEAGNLAWLLADTAGTPSPDGLLEVLKRQDGGAGGGFLTAGQAGEILALFSDEDSLAFAKALPKKAAAKVPAADWYGWFDALRGVYDPQGRIRDRALTVLGAGQEVTEAGGSALPEGTVFAAEVCPDGGDGGEFVPADAGESGEYVCFSDRLLEQDNRFHILRAVTRDRELYALRSVPEGTFRWRNVWLKEASAEGLSCFYEDHSFLIPCPAGADGLPDGPAGAGAAEQVADLCFAAGRLSRILPKEERICGRLLRVTEESAEVEGWGIFPFVGDCRIYRLHGGLKTLEKASLRIGYAFADFVLENGEIAAALVTKEERMDSIRVLIRTSGYGGLLHDGVRLQADCDCTVFAGPSGNRQERELPAGETLMIGAQDPLFAEGDRIRIVPQILTGHLYLPEVERAQERPAYRGSFEVLRTEEGLAVINEVLLEEYLYAVVPSEMPASYPAEALKSQAVCARTYAYGKMLRAGLGAYGAHLDDSVSFQVYQNLPENAAATEAVRLTKGQTLFWNGEAAEAYYYSTSCGFGTDASVWMEGNQEKYPYLRGLEIRSKDGYFEEEEPWYRWRYEVKALDVRALNQAIAQRYEANPSNVLVAGEDGSFVSERPEGTGAILDISVEETGAGGVVKALRITGEKESVLLKTEYNIRYVLCDRKTQVLRQDGSLAEASAILPSAFFTLELMKSGGAVTGYALSGGGFGHGVGMSQNGARRMAMAGMDAGEILAFFYPGCELRDIYGLR